MGNMMTYGRSGDAVVRWPDNAVARQALADYLAALPGDSLDITVPLGGGKLDFTGADLSQCHLRKAQGRACDARGAVFREADLQRAEFDDADLREADLSRTQLGGAFLAGADLRGASLRGCSFGQAGRSADLDEARLAGCLVDGATGAVIGSA